MNTAQELGPRLEAICELVCQAQFQQEALWSLPGRYDRVWDCCCDHGYLGLTLLQQVMPGTMCFVDQVPHITKKLGCHLAETGFTNYEVFTEDAGKLEFSKQERHLVIIAGVTGTNVIRILAAILENARFTQNAARNIDVIVCPTRGAYDVRDYMRSKSLALIHESLVSEKKRQYEILYVSCSQENRARSIISEVGNMWDYENPDHRRYLDGRICHYQREANGENRDRAKRALLAYQTIAGA